MSANKIIPVVIAGGALYYYDQNVNPIISRNFTNEKIPQPTFSPPSKAQIKNEQKTITKSIEDQYNKLETKTNELYQKMPSFNLTDTKDQVKHELENKKNDLTNHDGNVIRQGIASYFDWINSVGGSASYEAKIRSNTAKQSQAWFSWASKQADDAMETFDFDKAKTVNEYERSKASLDKLIKQYQNKHLTKEEQKALEQAQANFNSSLNHLQRYGSDLVDSINKNLEASKNSWFKWGNKKGDELSATYETQKQNAIKQYEASKKKFDELAANAKNSFKSDKERDEYLKAAQRDFDNSLSNLTKFGNDVVDDVNTKFQQQKDSWFKWSSKQQDKAAETYDQEKERALKNYELAKSKFNDLTAQIQNSNLFKTEKERDEHLKAAQADLNASFTNLRKFGSEWADKVDKEYYQPLKDKITK